MGNVTWNSGGSTDGNVAGNYNPARVPTTGDTWYADASSAVACIFSGNISCDGLNNSAASSVNVDFGDSKSHAWASAGMVFDHSGNVDLGTGTTHTITGGPLDWADLGGSWTRGTASIVFVGTCTLVAKDPGPLTALTISAGAALTASAGKPQAYGGTTLNGSLSLSAGVIYEASAGGTAMGNGSALAGAGTYRHYGHLGDDFTRSGTTTVDVAALQIRGSTGATVISPGTYASALTTFRADGTSLSWTASAGTYTFGNLTLQAAAAGDVTIDLATNNPTFTVDDLTFDLNSSGDAIFSPGAAGIVVQGDMVDQRSSTGIVTANSCPLTLTGTNAQSVALCGATWDLEIDKLSGTVTVVDAWSVVSLTGTDGDLDLDGQTVTASGAVTLASGFTVADPAGSTINCDTFTADGNDLIGSATWYLNATTSGTLANLTITNCDASGGVEVDATDKCIDGGGNTNVNFGVPLGAFRGTFSPAFAGAFG